jgi:hypothetical protein
MATKNPDLLVHFYDTQRRQILCEARGFEHRSTKHSRGVTCADCVRLLAARLAATTENAVEPASHSV